MLRGNVDAPLLDPFYYRDNFQRLINTVATQYADLLSAEENQFIDHWRTVGHSSQCLYVRLVSRVGPLFRVRGLNYSELEDIPTAVEALIGCGLAQQYLTLDISDLDQLYTSAELHKVFSALVPQQTSRKKGALLEAITELDLPEKELYKLAVAVYPDRIVGPCSTEVVVLLQLLFFGNRHQSLTDFVLSDLGVARYYPYTLDRDARLFGNRAALLEYLDTAALSDSYYEISEAGDVEALNVLAHCISNAEIQFSSSAHRYHRLCNAVARDLERHRQWELAAELYIKSSEHPARERLARIYEAQDDLSAALHLCETILDLPWCEEEAEAALRIIPRVRRKLDGTRTKRNSHTFAQMHLQLPSGSLSVELSTANHLASQWAEVAYVENRLMNTLFGLAFWEQIFAPVPGAFHNPYQSVPADMYQRTFQSRRAQLIDSRLAELANADLSVELSEAYQRYHKLQCHWVNWRHITPELLKHSLEIIPAEHLLAIWRRILFDPRANRSGFPDLIALGDQPGNYQLIEVKGPGDALQHSQKRWLHYFEKVGVPAAVAWVAWIEH